MHAYLVGEGSPGHRVLIGSVLLLPAAQTIQDPPWRHDGAERHHLRRTCSMDGASRGRGGRVSNVRRREHGTDAGPAAGVCVRNGRTQREHTRPHMMNLTSRREDPLLRRSADAMSAQQTATASVHMAAVAAALATARRMALHFKFRRGAIFRNAGTARVPDTHQRGRRLHPPGACPRAQVPCVCFRA